MPITRTIVDRDLFVVNTTSTYLPFVIDGLEQMRDKMKFGDPNTHLLSAAIDLAIMVEVEKGKLEMTPPTLKDPSLGDILQSAIGRNMQPSVYNKIALIKALRDRLKEYTDREDFHSFGLTDAKHIVEMLIEVNEKTKQSC